MSRAVAGRWAMNTLLVSLVFACEQAPSWPPTPAAFRASEDACSECRMFVSDARFAVQIHSRSGAVEWFDDLGCLLAREELAIEPEAVFVRDFGADAWVRGDQGHAMLVPGLDSPMGYGWTVHASAAAAQASALSEGAQRLALSELLRRRPPDAREPFTERRVTNESEDRR